MEPEHTCMKQEEKERERREEGEEEERQGRGVGSRGQLDSNGDVAVTAVWVKTLRVQLHGNQGHVTVVHCLT